MRNAHLGTHVLGLEGTHSVSQVDDLLNNIPNDSNIQNYFAFTGSSVASKQFLQHTKRAF
jgi:hypothetical protein